MFKKWISVLLCGLLLLGLAGCGKKFQEPEEDARIKDAPAYIADAYRKINQIARDNELTFRAPHYSTLGNTIDILRAEVGESATVENPYLDFVGDEAPEFIDRGFTIQNIDAARDAERPQLLKDIVTATIMYADPSLSLDSAKAKMQELFSSRPTADSETRYGDIIEVGEYMLWFSMDMSNKESVSFVKKDRLFWSYDTSATYKEMNKSNAKDAQWDNQGEYKVTAKVNDFILTKRGDYSSSEVEGADGQKYIVGYDFASYPLKLEVGKTYTFYGRIMLPYGTVGNEPYVTEFDGRSKSSDYPILSLVRFDAVS